MSQGTVKCEHWARNQCLAGSVCLACLSFLGKTRGRERGEMVRDGTERGWMDMQINNAMCGQTASPRDAISYTVAPHQASLTSTLTLALAHTHISRKGLWMIAVGHLWALFPLHMSHEFFKFLLNRFCPLLQLALMEAVADRAGGRDSWSTFIHSLNPRYCFYFWGNIICCWCLLNGHASRTHGEGCISASK